MKYYNNKTPNPNEYVYINGLGFENNPAAAREKQLIKSYSCLLGISIILLYILKMTLGGILYNFSYVFSHVSLLPQIIDILGYAVIFLLPFFLYGTGLGMPMSVAMPFKKPDKKIFEIVGMAMGCSVISISASKMLTAVLDFVGIHSMQVHQSIPTDIVGIIFFAIKSVIVASLIEEIVFRGFLLQSLRRFGDQFAILISAIIFAAVHTNIHQFTTAFIMGLVLGFSVIITGSLWTGIIIHTLHNAYLLALGYAELGLPSSYYQITLFTVGIVLITIFVVSIINLARKSDYIFDLKTQKDSFTTSQKSKIYFSTFSMIIVIVLTIVQTLQSIYFI